MRHDASGVDQQESRGAAADARTAKIGRIRSHQGTLDVIHIAGQSGRGIRHAYETHFSGASLNEKPTERICDHALARGGQYLARTVFQPRPVAGR